jgi:hypothetical protein
VFGDGDRLAIGSAAASPFSSGYQHSLPQSPQNKLTQPPAAHGRAAAKPAARKPSRSRRMPERIRRKDATRPYHYQRMTAERSDQRQTRSVEHE